MCSHIDDLKRFDPDIHSGIIFDDMDFRHMPRQAQIYITDIDNDRSIHVRYDTVFIPAGTKKIFTCNEEGFPFIDDAAIKRRYELHTLIKL